MAVSFIATIQRFQALSTDEWPTAPPDGSQLHVVDTGEEYIFHDGSWEHDLRMIRALQTDITL